MIDERTLLIIPRNFGIEGETYQYENSLLTISKIFSAKGIPYKILNDKPIEYVELRAADIFLPALFITYQIVTENKEIYEIALETIKEYLKTIYPFESKEKNVKFSLHVEKTEDKVVKILEYDGSIDGLSELKEAINRIADE